MACMCMDSLGDRGCTRTVGDDSQHLLACAFPPTLASKRGCAEIEVGCIVHVVENPFLVIIQTLLYRRALEVSEAYRGRPDPPGVYAEVIRVGDDEAVTPNRGKKIPRRVLRSPDHQMIYRPPAPQNVSGTYWIEKPAAGHSLERLVYRKPWQPLEVKSKLPGYLSQTVSYTHL